MSQSLANSGMQASQYKRVASPTKKGKKGKKQRIKSARNLPSSQNRRQGAQFRDLPAEAYDGGEQDNSHT